MPLLNRRPSDEDYSTSCSSCDGGAQNNHVDEQNNQSEEDIFEGFDWFQRPKSEDGPCTPEEIEEILAAIFDDPPGTNEVTTPDQKWTNEVTDSALNEGILPSENWTNEVTATTAKSLTNEVTKRIRRSDVSDRQIIDAIQKFAPSGSEDESAPLVANSHTPFSPSISASFPPSESAPSTPSISPSDSVSESSVGARSIPRWEHTHDRLKLAFANEALTYHSDETEAVGKRPVSWSLNLGPERINEALSHLKGFTGCLGGLLNRALQKHLGSVPLFWFVVDVENGRLHLHGGILASPDQFPLIEAAMIHAGGKWSAARGRKRQFHLEADRCDFGWSDYAIRNKGAVRKLIGPNICFIAKPLRREASWLYEQYRQHYRAHG